MFHFSCESTLGIHLTHSPQKFRMKCFPPPVLAGDLGTARFTRNAPGMPPSTMGGCYSGAALRAVTVTWGCLPALSRSHTDHRSQDGPGIPGFCEDISEADLGSPSFPCFLFWTSIYVSLGVKKRKGTAAYKKIENQYPVHPILGKR